MTATPALGGASDAGGHAGRPGPSDPLPTPLDVFDELASLVSYLRPALVPEHTAGAVGGPPAEPDGTVDPIHRADELLDPDHLRRAVAATAQGRGTDDPVVLASLWWQSYAYRVAGTTLAAWVVSGRTADPAVEAGPAIVVRRHRPAGYLVGPAATVRTDLDDIVERLFAGHLDPAAQALRARHRVGARLLAGNTVAAIASCLSAVACAEGAPDGIGARIDTVFAALPPSVARLGHWLEPHRSYRRTTCCLWWKTPPAKGAKCSDCSLT